MRIACIFILTVGSEVLNWLSQKNHIFWPTSWCRDPNLFHKIKNARQLSIICSIYTLFKYSIWIVYPANWISQLSLALSLVLWNWRDSSYSLVMVPLPQCSAIILTVRAHIPQYVSKSPHPCLFTWQLKPKLKRTQLLQRKWVMIR